VVSLSMVEPAPQFTHCRQQQQKIQLVRVMEVLFGDVGKEHHADIRRTRQGFDTIHFESTQMHVQLNCRHCCAVDPS